MSDNKSENKFENNILLEDIRKKLWSVDGKSRVSIMVGAGFSRNASKIDNSLNSMALWSDLKDVMIEALGINKDVNKLDVLELADSYESKFGIISLESLLKSQVPDENYEPNSLYTQLLSLPFSDVYTTNYDTLLERASKKIFERHYQLIHDIHDIPGSTSPRIVKLHGSFPSHRPFVFSKKSYDDYPIESAPFVNMVQQSIMETTLVLIGFSGDDPNFMKWIEWVSNSLGKHRPNIYLIGLDIKNNSEIFREYNISILDFDSLYQGIDEKYSVFFNDLFTYLSKKPSVDKRKWPHIKYPWVGMDKELDISDLIEILKENRLSYPGWLVMPYQINNRNLMTNIINSYFELLDKETILKKKIALTTEIIWLLRTFRAPIYYQQQNLLKKLIEEFSDNKNLEDELNNIELFLVRESRLDESDEFFSYIERLEKRKLSKDVENELFFQKILKSIHTLSNKSIREQLDSWQITNNSLEYQLKKACIFIKINEIDEGLLLVENVLKAARRIQSISMNNYFALSIEGICLNLIKTFRNNSLEESYFNRLIDLEQYFCSVSVTIEYISNFKREVIPNKIERKKNFDGKTTISHNIGFYGKDDFEDAFFLISLYDDYNLGITTKSKIDILNFIRNSYPKYTEKRFLKFARLNEIDIFFSKDQIYKMTSEQILNLYDFIKNLLKEPKINNINLLLDVSFRLYMVLDIQRQKELEQVLLEFYSDSEKMKILDNSAQEIFDKCLYRVINSKTPNNINDFCNVLFNMPIIGEKDTSLQSNVLDMNFTFDLIEILDKYLSIEARKNIIVKDSKYITEKLIGYLSNENEKDIVKIASMGRLLFLESLGGMDQNNYKLMRNVIDSLIQNNSVVLKKYNKSNLIIKFFNESKHLDNYFAEILNKELIKSVHGAEFRYGVGLSNQLMELGNMLQAKEYSEEFYTKLLYRLSEWWENQYIHLKDIDTTNNLFRNNDILQIIVFIKNKIFRNIKKKYFNTEMKNILIKCFNDLESDENHLSGLLIPGILKINGNHKNLFINIKNDVLNSNVEIMKNAIISIQDIAYFKMLKEIDVNIREIKVILLQLLSVQKESALKYVTSTIYLILRESPSFFTEKEMEEIIFNIEQFYLLYITNEAQSIFEEDVFNEIVENYFKIIIELKNKNYFLDSIQQWIDYADNSKYIEIKKYLHLLESI